MRKDHETDRALRNSRGSRETVDSYHVHALKINYAASKKETKKRPWRSKENDRQNWGQRMNRPRARSLAYIGTTTTVDAL